jgi:hypothetical protein
MASAKIWRWIGRQIERPAALLRPDHAEHDRDHAHRSSAGTRWEHGVFSATPQKVERMTSKPNIGPSNGRNAGEIDASSDQATRGSATALKKGVANAVDQGKADIAFSVDAARVSFDEDFRKLKADLAGLQETMTRFASGAGGAAAITVKNVGHTVASHAGSAAGELAGSATDQIKTFASELEGMARRNPLRALAGTLALGVLVGMMTRSRRV